MKRFRDLLTYECKAELVSAFNKINTSLFMLSERYNHHIHSEHGETVEKRLEYIAEWTNKLSEQVENLKAIKIVLKEEN